MEGFEYRNDMIEERLEEHYTGCSVDIGQGKSVYRSPCVGPTHSPCFASCSLSAGLCPLLTSAGQPFATVGGSICSCLPPCGVTLGYLCPHTRSHCSSQGGLLFTTPSICGQQPPLHLTLQCGKISAGSNPVVPHCS